MATRPSSPMRHKSISNFPHLTISSKSRLLIELPEGFFTWLTSFFVDMAQIKDLSVLKYFTKLCYLTVHINSTFLNDLLDNDAFFAFIRNIDTIIPFIDDAKTAAFIWKQITATSMDELGAGPGSHSVSSDKVNNDAAIELPIDQLVDLFYALTDDDVNLSKLISIFTKIYAGLPGFGKPLRMPMVYDTRRKDCFFFTYLFNRFYFKIRLS
ncbi:CIC_collapsed_G0000760.mRNA.1.CDS.1 [Saccharomyces cerevisiae]|nr:CIC_collapsed_G0000760.mRNA.1.CDS.1 [Saccharomyces cerevisiae]